ncbi:hypothetical protein [Rhizomonospora bruguierae]|uniref:hypothetical protein n=1 Tax=Rhizomonospora bruguierae TaxID=1581705 RepID=UPI001BCF17EE|nr:hypothetical protein [Micromonospora sp. NBRC 107566]
MDAPALVSVPKADYLLAPDLMVPFVRMFPSALAPSPAPAMFACTELLVASDG